VRSGRKGHVPADRRVVSHEDTAVEDDMLADPGVRSDDDAGTEDAPRLELRAGRHRSARVTDDSKPEAECTRLLHEVGAAGSPDRTDGEMALRERLQLIDPDDWNAEQMLSTAVALPILAERSQ